MKRILLICTGNACRSAAAECVLKQKLEQRGITGFEVESAGTLDWGENPRDEVMVRIASEHGYHLDGVTRCMTEKMLNEADRVIL